MSVPVALITSLSILSAGYIFFVKEPKTTEDKMVGGLLLTGGIMLLFWPSIKDKLVWG
tara:strand:+ start:2606 stop:2779 length:174 start_codon:yes stop_codon:yes gene_type:complete